MKAIFINSKEKVIHAIELSRDQNQRMAEIYDRLECRLFEIAHYFDNGDALFVDEEGLLTVTNETTFFSIDGMVLVGNGLILGREVENKDSSYSIEDSESDIDSLNIRFLSLEDVQEAFKEVS